MSEMGQTAGNHIDKLELVKALREHLEKELEVLKAAALATYEAATHEESKPENEYDTRGLEAAYLAGAQAKRAGEIEELLSICKFIEVKKFSDEAVISATALVEVEHLGKISYVFVMPKGGGVNFKFAGHTIQIVTPHSPLGEALVGLRVGDVASIEVSNVAREYEILSIS